MKFISGRKKTLNLSKVGWDWGAWFLLNVSDGEQVFKILSSVVCNYHCIHWHLGSTYTYYLVGCVFPAGLRTILEKESWIHRPFLSRFYSPNFWPFGDHGVSDVRIDSSWCFLLSTIVLEPHFYLYTSCTHRGTSFSSRVHLLPN